MEVAGIIFFVMAVGSLVALVWLVTKTPVAKPIPVWTAMASVSVGIVAGALLLHF